MPLPLQLKQLKSDYLMNFEISPLLHPISEQSPCGVDLAFSNAFHEIKLAKTQDDLLLDQGDWVVEPKQADWSFVASKSIELLSGSTKDIRLLTWLTESWSNLSGLIGLQKGLSLSHQMLSTYWVDIHPIIEDDDLDQRLGLIKGLINQIPVLIKKSSLTMHTSGYNLLDYENFLYQQNNRRKHSEEADNLEPLVEMDQFETAIQSITIDFRKQQYDVFQQILKEWQNIKDVLNQLLEIDAPSFAQIDSNLENINKNIQKIYKTDSFIQSEQVVLSDEGLAQTDLTLSSAVAVTNTANLNAGFSPEAQNHIHNREQAMRVLSDIAEYFSKNEPHSPVSYMLDKTIAWSKLPLHEWLAQVIKDDQPLASIHELLGVKNQSNESNNW